MSRKNVCDAISPGGGGWGGGQLKEFLGEGVPLGPWNR